MGFSRNKRNFYRIAPAIPTYHDRRLRKAKKRYSANHRLSKGESKVRNICRRLFSKYEIKYNNRTVLGRLELDIYIPAFKFAIEFNGGQHYVFTKRFHRNQMGFLKQLGRDKIKQMQCDSLGIKLLTITEQNEEKIKNIIIEFIKEHHLYSQEVHSDRENYDPLTKVEGLTN